MTNEHPKDTPDVKAGIDNCRKGGQLQIGTGLAIGGYGTTAALTAGYICPVCVVATPLLLGLGYRNLRKAKKLEAEHETDTATE